MLGLITAFSRTSDEKLMDTVGSAARGCNSLSPDAGHEVVLIDKPVFFVRLTGASGGA
jgi:hypothetical protein